MRMFFPESVGLLLWKNTGKEMVPKYEPDSDIIIERIFAERAIKKLRFNRSFRAIDGARTRGLDLGKVARYQLRHYRNSYVSLSVSATICILHDKE